MIVRRFLSWAQTASAAERAEGARILARAYLHADLPSADVAEAEMALTALVDDPSPLVRGALAESFASAETAPKNLILALASDQSQVALPILSRSPVLSEFDLMDLAASADSEGQIAIADRLGLPKTVSAVLAETSCYAAALVLVENERANLSDASCRRLIQRFDRAELREVLLARAGLSISLRYDLVQATARALTQFVASCGWMSKARLERVTAEAEQNAAVALASGEKVQDISAFVSHLAACGALRPKLLLRSLLTGSVDLFQAALVLLTQERLPRILAFQRDPKGSGFAALYRRAKLPEALLTAFRSVLVMRAANKNAVPTVRQTRDMIAVVLRDCKAAGHLSPTLTLFLQRLDADAAREMARGIQQDAPVIAHGPEKIPVKALVDVTAALQGIVADIAPVQAAVSVPEDVPVPQPLPEPVMQEPVILQPVAPNPERALSFEAKFVETMLARALPVEPLPTKPVPAPVAAREKPRMDRGIAPPTLQDILENRFITRTLSDGVQVPKPKPSRDHALREPVLLTLVPERAGHMLPRAA